MTRRAREWLLDRLPAGLLHQPAEWALAALCAFSGVVTLGGWRNAPTVAETLHWAPYKLWGLLLLLGAAALAAALASTRRAGAGFVVTRVPAYRLGLRLIGLGQGVYVFCLLWTVGPPALQAAVAPAAVLLLCAVRLLTLGGRR